MTEPNELAQKMENPLQMENANDKAKNAFALTFAENGRYRLFFDAAYITEISNATDASNSTFHGCPVTNEGWGSSNSGKIAIRTQINNTGVEVSGLSIFF
jgi:hypothetical protein